MAASALGWLDTEQIVEMLERIQYADFEVATLAVTSTSVRWPIPRVTTVALYGF